jgi:aldehyde:ferredoxin oxidoreductase
VALSRADFDAALTELYRLKGWDPVTTRPSREKLAELGIEGVGY